MRWSNDIPLATNIPTNLELKSSQLAKMEKYVQFVADIKFLGKKQLVKKSYIRFFESM